MNPPAPPVTIAAAAPDGIDRAELQQLWLAVTLAGGAVGLRAPATLQDTAPLVDDLLARADSGEVTVFTATADHTARLVGLVGLYREAAARREHRATLRRLMVAPDRQGTGIGSALLAAAHTHARRAALELVLVEIRDGLGLEPFYERHGYRACGRIPGGLWFDDDRIDELLYVADLRADT